MEWWNTRLPRPPISHYINTYNRLPDELALEWESQSHLLHVRITTLLRTSRITNNPWQSVLKNSKDSRYLYITWIYSITVPAKHHLPRRDAPPYQMFPLVSISEAAISES